MSDPAPVLDFVLEMFTSSASSPTRSHPTPFDGPTPNPLDVLGPIPFGAIDDGHDLELAFCEVPNTDDPLAPLAGIDAHPSWNIYGVVANARAIVELPRPHSPGVPARSGGATIADRGWVGFAANREGVEAARLGFADTGQQLAAERLATGRIPDLVRRGLGLACPAPNVESVGFTLTVLWLSHILDFVLAQPLGSPPVTWNQIEVLHPAAQLLPKSLAPLDQRAADAAQIVDWGWLRRAVRDRSIEVPHLPPSHAGWFDDGSFSRWLPTVLPPFREVGQDLIELLPAPVCTALFGHIEFLLDGPLGRTA